MSQTGSDDIHRANLLSSLKTRSNWICWASHRHPHKNEKIPINPQRKSGYGDEFTPTDYQRSKIQMSYSSAYNRFRDEDPINGVGFVMMDSPFYYIDLDNCVRDGRIEGNVKDFIERMNSYTEISTSGTGLHIIGRGSVPTYGWDTDSGFSVEIYDGSWVAITQNHIPGTPPNPQRRDDFISDLFERYDIDTEEGW